MEERKDIDSVLFRTQIHFNIIFVGPVLSNTHIHTNYPIQIDFSFVFSFVCLLFVVNYAGSINCVRWLFTNFHPNRFLCETLSFAKSIFVQFFFFFCQLKQDFFHANFYLLLAVCLLSSSLYLIQFFFRFC